MADLYALLKDTTTIGERIRLLIGDEEISLSELSRRSNVGKGYLWELTQRTEEAAKMKPSAETLYGVATALGVSVGDLLGKTLPPADDESTWPPGLATYVRDKRVPKDEARMLAGIRTRGGTPTKPDQWEQIHYTILMHTGRLRRA